LSVRDRRPPVRLVGEVVPGADSPGAVRARWQRAARQDGAQRAAHGLVLAAYLAVHSDGRLVELKLPGIAPKAPEKRGKCEGMSDDSKRRLNVLLHRVRRDFALPTMVTLTFPEELTVSPGQAKACRAAWEKRQMREFGPDWCAVWRLEAHPEMSKRLARVHPHFHLLTWGAWYDLRKVSKSWAEVVFEVLGIHSRLRGADGRLVFRKFVKAGTNCEKVRSWNGVDYCAKRYLTKAEEFPLGAAGRVWGYCNRRALPLSEVLRIPLDIAEAAAVVGQVKKWMDERKIVSEGICHSFFDPDPSALAEWFLSGQVPVLRPGLPTRPRVVSSDD